MKKIEKMDYASDYNVAAMWIKLNEIIDVLNKLTTPVIAKAETERTLWINQHCAVIEFCCDELKERIIYYNIILYTDYEKGTTTGMLETREMDHGKLIIKHIDKCPYCGASIKYKATKKIIIQKEIKKDIMFIREIAFRKIHRSAWGYWLVGLYITNPNIFLPDIEKEIINTIRGRLGYPDRFGIKLSVVETKSEFQHWKDEKQKYTHLLSPEDLGIANAIKQKYEGEEFEYIAVNGEKKK